MLTLLTFTYLCKPQDHSLRESKVLNKKKYRNFLIVAVCSVFQPTGFCSPFPKWKNSMVFRETRSCLVSQKYARENGGKVRVEKKSLSAKIKRS